MRWTRQAALVAPDQTRTSQDLGCSMRSCMGQGKWFGCNVTEHGIVCKRVWSSLPSVLFVRGLAFQMTDDQEPGCTLTGHLRLL